MADNGDIPEQKEKLPIDDPEAGYAENELDDSKAKFINGGALDETKVEVVDAKKKQPAFTGLGKDELKMYAEDPFWVRLRWILFILFWVGWLAMLVSAIVIIVLAPRCPTRPDLKWYHKDSSYNIYSKSFFDGKKDDGYGDLDGVQQKQSYVESLGANVLWLSSIFKTEGGNDRAIIDHKMVDEKFGTIDALKSFCRQLMKKSKRVILDVVPNQTSKNHTWFVKSQMKEGKYASYYVWAKKANNWMQSGDASQSMWALDPVRNEYYLSQFDSLPDLNLSNPDVIEEFKEIIQFWAGVGVSGFHINDMEFLAENSTLVDDDGTGSGKETRNFAGNADVIHSLREIVDGMDNKPGREKMLFGTVTSSANTEQMKIYAGQDEKRGLSLVAVVLDALTETVSAADLQTAMEPFINMTTKNWLGWRLSTPTPGTDRVFTRVGADRLTVAHALQTLLPGSSLPYYGDEIAMSSGVDPTRKTVTPMQWSKRDSAGFTSATPWLAVNADYTTKNLESLTAQLGNDKLVDSFKALGALRSAESLQFGKTMFCTKGDLFIFSRNAEGFESYVVAINMGPATTYRLMDNKCVGGRADAELVFHSSDDGHTDTQLNLNSAVHIGQNEVLVFKFPK